MVPEQPNAPRPDPGPRSDNAARAGDHAPAREEELRAGSLEQRPLESRPLELGPLEFGAVRPEDDAGMMLALEQARAARAMDEVPIGAVILLDGEVIGSGHNRVRTDRSPLAHAELRALSAAVATTGDARLPGAQVYTTVEPCFMCAGALSHARVARVVWGVRDPKFGGCASLGRVLTDPRANHRAELVEGVRADEARELLQLFFRSKREAAKRSD